MNILKKLKIYWAIKNFFPLLESGNFKEFYYLLLRQDVQLHVIGETTKLFYNALKTDPLNTLSEVPDYFLTFTDLTKIKIPNHVTIIGDYSFAFNIGLKEVILPSNLKVLGVSCFLSSPKLEEITIPKSLEEIKSRAFESCPKLNKIYYEGTFEDFLKIKNNVNFANNYREIHCTDATLYFSHIKDRWINFR